MRKKLSHPMYKSPLHFVLRLRLQKGGGGGGGGGRICGTLWYMCRIIAILIELRQCCSHRVCYIYSLNPWGKI